MMQTADQGTHENMSVTQDEADRVRDEIAKHGIEVDSVWDLIQRRSYPARLIPLLVETAAKHNESDGEGRYSPRPGCNADAALVATGYRTRMGRSIS